MESSWWRRTAEGKSVCLSGLKGRRRNDKKNYTVGVMMFRPDLLCVLHCATHPNAKLSISTKFAAERVAIHSAKNRRTVLLWTVC